MNIKLYLDNCCFNRPFDDQNQLRIQHESTAKLKIQDEIRNGKFKLVWSYILEYENSMNPFEERKIRIKEWSKYADHVVQENEKLLEKALLLNNIGLKKFDSLHIACAIHTECEYFITTDDRILKHAHEIKDINVFDPITFIKEVRP